MLTGTELHRPLEALRGTAREAAPRFVSEGIEGIAPLTVAAPLMADLATFDQDTLRRVLSSTRGARTQLVRAESFAAELIQRPVPATAAASIWALQAWEGRVVLAEGEQFTAILRDLTDHSRPDEEVTIEMAAVDPSDRILVTESAAFFWSVFQEVRQGTRRVVSDLRFRRLPAWTRTEINELKRRARERAQRFGVQTDRAGID